VTRATTSPAVLELHGVSKDYRGLRPLRIHELRVAPGDRIALVGVDRVSAEVIVDLVTGATLPDAGHVTVFGRRTVDIADARDWLALIDRFGIVSQRAVLLEALTTVQNLAIPFTLDIEPLGGDARARAEALAREVGLADGLWDRAVGALSEDAKARIRLGRALALDPHVLLLEHASAPLAPADAIALGDTIHASAARRGVALVAATADEAFARAMGARLLRWEPASGRLRERGGWFRG
jgi:predicted ABC-type transport system involved in lysophospholipase L1 biosynthesis ATPase subunit